MDSSRLKSGEHVALLSILAAAGMGITKGAVGFASGSVSTIADAAHTTSDLFASLAVFVGLRLVGKRPTARFPYGFSRAETIASLVVSAIVLFSGLEILRESLNGILTPVQVFMPTLIILVESISAIVSFVLSIRVRHVGMKIGSQALVGEAKHMKIDIMISSVVLIGILLSHSGIPESEAAVGLGISLVVIWTGLSMGKDAIVGLMDVSAEPRLMERVREIAMQVPGIVRIGEIKSRRSGPSVFLELHAQVERSVSTEEAQRISQSIRERVEGTVREVDSVTVLIEPGLRNNLTVAVPVDGGSELDSSISDHFGGADSFMFIRVDSGAIVDTRFHMNPASKQTKKKGIAAARFLIEQHVDALLCTELGEGPFHALDCGLIRIYRARISDTIRENVEALVRGDLEILKEPVRETDSGS